MTEETATDSPSPQIADRLTWQAKIDELRVKEKAHTRAGDALATERRRLPMVEVDPQTPLIGADGPVMLIDLFDGRSQLIAYFQMWHTGRQEFWEDSPESWPQRWGTRGGQMRLDGRPTAQWSRIKDGRNDDLGATSGGHSGQHCH